ncbi:hypothetical protein C0966_04430 [Bacillus methanolicus]|uniref:hypothetical protein n=1 Tax=Bacillus methanolicus TaxID=1471 RepID=UPI00238048BA|nr:hypothetical protein [Bacillus methanolicus]MDE3838635.1 hypothetical protein [Bacillus methanolicus]
MNQSMMKTTATEKEYLVFADVKMIISRKIQANSEDEALFIATNNINDTTLKELRLQDGYKLYLKHENGEVVEPSVVDFSIEITSIDEEY